MPVFAASSVGVGVSDMTACSHIANYLTTPEVRNSRNDGGSRASLYADMAKTDDQPINSGPNYLADWIEFRGLTQGAVASTANISKGMMSDLVNGKRGPTASYLRRFAKILNCRPGDILDFHPHDVPPELRDILRNATPEDRSRIAAVAETIMKYDASPTRPPRRP